MNQEKLTVTIVKGTLAICLANASAQIVNTLLLPVYSKYLNQADFGVFSLVSMIITILALIYNPGMITATTRMYYLAEEEKQRRILIGSSYMFFILIAILPITVGLFFGEHIFELIFKDFNYYPFGFMATVLAFFIQPVKVWIVLKTLQKQLHKTAIYSIISVCLGAITALVLIVEFKMGALGRVIGMFPAALFLFIISLISIIKYTDRKWNFESIKKQVIFGSPLIIGLWAYQGLNFVGIYTLQQFKEMSDVGLYSFGMIVSGVPALLILGFKQMWSPILFENLKNKNYTLVKNITKHYIVTLTFVFLTFNLFIKEVFYLIIDNKFHDSVTVIYLISLGIYFSGLIIIGSGHLTYNKKLGRISLICLIALVINIFLNIILTPIYGIVGTAISFLAAYGSYFVISTYDQRKKIFEINKLREIIVPILFMACASITLFYMSLESEQIDINILEITFKLLYIILLILSLFISRIYQYNDIKYIINIFKEQKLK